MVVSQVMPFPRTQATPLSAEYLAAGKAAHVDGFEPNYSSMEGCVAARTVVEGLKHGGSSSADTLVAGL